MAIETINPATGKSIAKYDALTAEDIEAALARANHGAAAMRNALASERINWLECAARILKDEKEELGKLLTLEMGKTYASAIAEVEKCAEVCTYYAENGDTLLADKLIMSRGSRSFVRYLPLGTVLAVMPWNYPFWQVFRFAAPTILAGNAGLLKHASNVPQSALAIADVLSRAGLPRGGFQTLLITGSQVASILEDKRVSAVTLTGSEGAGSAVAQAAGKMLKPSLLELGGSDPFIVMPSADIDLAVEKAVSGRTKNNGQSCIAAKRFIVHAEIYNDFRERFAAALDALKIGNPMDEETDIGPLATDSIRNELAEQVEKTISMGAKRVTGAKMIEGDGWYYKPGLLEDIPAGSPADKDELFGPVASLFKVANLQEAIELANSTRFGLGSSLFTREESEIQLAFNQIDAGATFINDITTSDPSLPFGGVKSSGYGRELAQEGLYTFMNAKTCVVEAL